MTFYPISVTHLEVHEVLPLKNPHAHFFIYFCKNFDKMSRFQCSFSSEVWHLKVSFWKYLQHAKTLKIWPTHQCIVHIVGIAMTSFIEREMQRIVFESVWDRTKHQSIVHIVIWIVTWRHFRTTTSLQVLESWQDEKWHLKGDNVSHDIDYTMLELRQKCHWKMTQIY